MQQLKQLMMTLALLMTAAAGAWATDPKVYDSGDVDVRDLHEGDILMAGVTIISTVDTYDSAVLDVNRYAENGTTTTTGSGKNVGTPTIGENGLLYDGIAHTYTPVTEGGEAGDAWVVLSIEDQSWSTHNYKTVHLGGIKAPLTVAWNAETKQGTLKMPGGNVLLNVLYKDRTAMALTYGGTAITTEANAVTAYKGCEQEFATALTAAVQNMEPTYSSGTAVDVTTTLADDFIFASSDANKIGFKTATEGEYLQTGTLDQMEFRDLTTSPVMLTVTYKGTADLESKSQVLSVTITENTYAVKMADAATEPENANWTIASGNSSVTGDNADGLTGLKETDAVTLTYDGRMKVKGITATVTAPAPAGNPVDLSTLTADFEAQSGDVLSGETSHAVTIPAGATVTLYEVTITNNRIICAGDATIVLAEGSLNMVTATGVGAAIRIGDKGTTLTIDGTGILFAQGYKYGAGIGTDDSKPGGHIVINNGTIIATGDNSGAAGIGTGDAYNAANECGNITINNGTITATGGAYAAGIGTGTTSSSDYKNKCGDIKINGGTVIAKSNGNGAAIGTGRAYQNSQTCGDITIGTGVTKVTAKGSPCSIGAGKKDYGMSQTVGTITIGGTVYPDGITESPFNYPPSN